MENVLGWGQIMDADGAIILTIITGIGAVSCLWAAHAANRKFRLVEAMPTSRAQGVFIGLVELKGTAEGEPMVSFLTETECLLYKWSVSEEWRRTVVETYRDQEGRTRTRNRVESGWTTLAQGGEARPFYVRDETGAVQVRPEGAEVRPQQLLSETLTSVDGMYYGKGPMGEVPHSTGRRRFEEDGIPLHAEVFVVGQARERGDVVAAEVAEAPGVPMYLVTTEGEAAVLQRFGRSRDWMGFLGLLLGMGCGFGVGVWSGWEPVWTAAAAVAVYLSAWGATWVWMLFNSLVDVRNRVRQGWSLMEVQLKRRHDLIPPLVAAVDGLRLHEGAVTAAVAELRAQQEATAPGVAGPDPHGTAATVAGIAEAYPVLKTSDAFLRLQKSLTETEQRIALSRDYFNDIATAYNTRLEVFPESMLARVFGFTQQPLLAAAEFERAPVQVSLAATGGAVPAGAG